MATTRKKTTTTERADSTAPQAASRAAARTSPARSATASQAAGQAPTEGAPAPSWERVSRRAFELWQEAGQPQGQELEHWLRAETELGVK